MVLKDKDADLKMKQISQFQLAETLLSIAREKSEEPNDLNRRVENFILPIMNKGFELDKSTTIAADINQRMSELMKEFDLDPNVLANGRRVGLKRYFGSASQKMKFDDNISLTNEENNVQQSKKESYVFDTELYAKYDFIAKKRFIISPEVRFNYTQHSDRSSPEVYQNDNYILSLNLKNKYEHKVSEKPASFIFDIDYSKTYKDFNATKNKEYYATSNSFTFGESLSIFDIGDTTLKFKRKNYSGHINSLNKSPLMTISLFVAIRAQRAKCSSNPISLSLFTDFSSGWGRNKRLAILISSEDSCFGGLFKELKEDQVAFR